MDRRGAQRVPVRLAAMYRSETFESEGLVTDLSRGGLFFAGISGDRIGAPATIDVELPDARLTLSGRVARRIDGSLGIGFSFDELAADARRALANMMLSAHSAA